MAQTSKTGG